MLSDENRDVVDNLYKAVGVSPSNQWLDACRTFLRNTGISSSDNLILSHILKSDLRDVVRPTDISGSKRDIGELHGDGQEQQSPSNRLRAAIKASQTRSQSQPSQSMSGNNRLPSMVEILDNSFRLMCQVEEVVDVSLNSEARLDTAGSVSTEGRGQPGPIQRLRCLKLCITDGFDSMPIIGIETSPILNLSPMSKAGLKIAVTGPIEVRWGVLQLHPGNTLVLGGFVQELVDFQRKTISQAKQAAGVGVDPTIRALIGTTPIEPEEEQDEGEGESGDVVASPQPLAAPTRHLDSSVSVTHANAQPMSHTSTSHFSHGPTIANPSGHASNGSTNAAQSSTTPPTSSSAFQDQQLSENPSKLATRTNLSYRNPYDVSSASSTNSQSSKPLKSASHQVLTSNPYSRNRLSSTAEINTKVDSHTPSTFVTASALANTASLSSRQFAPHLNKNPSKSTTSVVPMEIDENDSTLNTSVKPMPAAPAGNSAGSPVNKIRTPSSLSSMSALTTASTVVPSDTPYTLSRSIPVKNMSHSKAQNEPNMTSVASTMSFENLRKLLIQVVSNEELYKTYFGQVFTVTLVQRGSLVHYNVEKRKDWKKKKGAKQNGDEGSADKVRQILRVPQSNQCSYLKSRFFIDVLVRICDVCKIRRSLR